MYLRIRYDDGCSGTFYKTFDIRFYPDDTELSHGEMRCNRDCAVCLLLMDVLPYNVFSAWEQDCSDVYVRRYGKIEYNTPVDQIVEKAGDDWIIDVRMK